MRVVLRSGDTLWSYSRLFDVPVELIEDSNPDADPQNLFAGRSIEIPGYIATDYRIAPGDTLWTIAQARELPLGAVLLLNPGVQPDRLYVGHMLRLPVRVTWPIVETGRPYTYAALTEDLNRLAAVYPFLRRRSIGTTVMGKPILEASVGRGGKRVHANGAFHANEWITTPLLVRFLDEYARALTTGGTIRGLAMAPYYRSATLSVVPMVNPDGVNLVLNGLPPQEPYRSEALAINEGSRDFSGWKANIRGVDLNNQFPALWELEADRKEQEPAPRDFPGTAPLTEPEAQAMAALAEAGDFARVLSFHAQGEMICWGFQDLQPPESEALADEFARVSGYRAIEDAGSYAGFKDWFIQEWGRPGFTIEAGRGVNPLPLAQFEEIYERSLGFLLAALHV